MEMNVFCILTFYLIIFLNLYLCRNHPLREYLDSTQLQMLKRRNGPTSAESTFTNKWSGIDHRIKMRSLPSKPLDTAEIGDSNEVEEKTAFRRKLLRGGNNNEVNINMQGSFHRFISFILCTYVYI